MFVTFDTAKENDGCTIPARITISVYIVRRTTSRRNLTTHISLFANLSLFCICKNFLHGGVIGSIAITVSASVEVLIRDFNRTKDAFLFSRDWLTRLIIDSLVTDRSSDRHHSQLERSCSTTFLPVYESCSVLNRLPFTFMSHRLTGLAKTARITQFH